jgi:DNA-binding IclR family transcriptional regulator
MACIDATGTLTPTGLLLMRALAEQPLPPEDIAKHLGEPTFKVRGSLRELADAEFIEEDGGSYHLTDAGREKL